MRERQALLVSLFYLGGDFMTYRDSLHFQYNNDSTENYGIVNVNVESGLLEETFLPTRSIKTVKVRGRVESYFQGIEYEPKRLEVTVAFENTFNKSDEKRLADWLLSDYYKPLIFSSQPERIYYAIVEGDSSLFHNAAAQGYVKLSFLCNTPYTYSPVYASLVYNYSSNTANGTIFPFDNKGSFVCRPIVKIQKVGNGDIRIVNTSDSGKELSLTGLLDGESITIDNEIEDIVTSIPNTYRFNNHNGVFIELVKGFNYLLVYGNCKLEWTYQFQYST